jgi:hypothetical protein
MIKLGVFIYYEQYYYHKSLKYDYCYESVQRYKNSHGWLMIHVDNILGDMQDSRDHFIELYDYEEAKQRFISSLYYISKKKRRR